MSGTCPAIQLQAAYTQPCTVSPTPPPSPTPGRKRLGLWKQKSSHLLDLSKLKVWVILWYIPQEIKNLPPGGRLTAPQFEFCPIQPPPAPLFCHQALSSILAWESSDQSLSILYTTDTIFRLEYFRTKMSTNLSMLWQVQSMICVELHESSVSCVY